MEYTSLQVARTIKCRSGAPPVSSLHLVRVHWEPVEARQIVGVPMQTPPWQTSPVVQFLPSLQAVPLRKVESQSPAAP
jgi:hypothetical protein